MPPFIFIPFPGKLYVNSLTLRVTMLELLSAALVGNRVSDKTLNFSDFQNRNWAGSAPASSTVLAPNGDPTQNFSAASSTFLDIGSKIGEGPFTIGVYVQPSSYQAQYGNSAPVGQVFQIGAFSSGYNALSVRPGTGTASYPKTVSFVVYSDQVAPVGEWHHVAAAFDPATSTCRLFVDGKNYGDAIGAAVAALTLSLGGIGDRPGFTGANDARYGYRGLMSTVRVRGGLQSDDFDPVTW